MRDNNIYERVKLALESANASARHFRTIYSFYLFFALFFLINVLTTDQELLFREGHIQMPIVNVSVPVVRFFIVSPLVLLILHFNLLIQALFLSKKIALYSLQLARYDGSGKSYREALDSLFPMPLVYLIANIYKKKSMIWLLGTVVFISIAILPITILIFTQVRFLPYQNETFTWIHRITVLVDIGMLCWIWPHVTLPNKSWRDGYRKIGNRHLFLAIMIILVFVTFFLYVPGGGISRLLPQDLDNGVFTFPKRNFDLSTKVLVSEEPAPVLLSAHYSAECIPENGEDCDSSVIKPGSEFWCAQTKPLVLNERNLKGAILSKTKLCAVNFEYADLSGADLTGANLTGANLKNTDLTGANLTGANLIGVDLATTNLTGANLSGVDLATTNLTGANLTGVDLATTNLTGANLTGVNLTSMDLTGANLIGVDLSGANLTEVDLAGADLSEANLTGADLTRANLTGADLTGVDLTRANLTGANLIGVDLTVTNLTGTNLTGANLSNVDLIGMELKYADLSGVDLSEVDLTEVDLAYADLTSANLTGANLTGADLAYADLTSANLTGANLTGADLAYTDLFEADLIRADLSGVSLKYANLTGADLSGANLTGADLAYADLTRANLTGADLAYADMLFTIGVTQLQFSQACGNHTTKLAEGLRITPCG